MSTATTRHFARLSPIGMGLTTLAAALVVAGVANLVDATNRWQDVLNALNTRSSCSTIPLSLQGYGNTAVLILGCLSLLLLGLTAWATLGPRRWGIITSMLTIVPIGILWMDSYAVSQSPGDCDSSGAIGLISTEIVRAGWLFLAAIVTCAIVASWIRSAVRRAELDPWRLGLTTERGH